MSTASNAFVETGYWLLTTAFFPASHPGDGVGVLFGDDAALQLERWRELSGVNAKVAVQEGEAADFLEVREFFAEPVDLGLDLPTPACAGNERGRILSGNSSLLRPCPEPIEVRHHQSTDHVLSITQKRGLGNERARLQPGLNGCRRDVLPVGQDEDLLFSVGD